MQTDRLRTLLDSASEAGTWLGPLGIEDPRTAHANLTRLAGTGLPLDLLASICDQFAVVAPELADPDMALNNLERFLRAARSPLATAALFERDPESLPRLLKLMNTSQTLSDLLCVDPESYDLLRMTEGSPVARQFLIDELCTELEALEREDEAIAALRRFKRRETLRIAYGDIVKEQPIAVVTRQISYVADAVVEAAVRFAARRLNGKSGAEPGLLEPVEGFAVLALGKLGGLELNYSSDTDLVFVYDEPIGSNGSERSYQAATDRVNRIGRDLVRLLSEPTELGFAYRVDLRLRPEGANGPLCASVDHALAYYDTRGRTWERQAYVKARVVAGDTDLGQHFLDQLEPWVYRRYLTLADITGIKALKRKIEDSAGLEHAERDVKVGRGGIRDIEFVIQFLQLLNGGASPSLRTGNTLEAISALEGAGCLTHQERTLLEENYCYLRRVEHRLQIMFDLQTHRLPVGGDETARLARRMGYEGTETQALREAFEADYRQKTEQNRRMLDHLLHDAFGEDAQLEPEVDLVNDPDPSAETIREVMSRYPFRDPEAAYANLMSLGNERIPFLSTRRCRLFLAAIAPRLLASIGATPDPDSTLVTLSRVSDSIGGKGALWELFSANPPSLNLYVTLCAECPYLSGILTGNPGMVDDLTDSLLIGRLPDQAMLEGALAELVRGAEDMQPILHSFKNAHHLRVGVRDILGKDRVESTHRVLSDIAEACLKQIVNAERDRLEEKYGVPTIEEPDSSASEEFARWRPEAGRVGQPCDLIILGMGKLGGREPNYHSDLDLVFLYEGEGHTATSRRHRNGSTTNSHFFNELGQRITKVANEFGPYGRLFEVDTRLRPTGRAGVLALPIEGFVRYFHEGSAQLWERLALCKARVITGGEQARSLAADAVAEAAFGPEWRPEYAVEIRDMRMKLQESATLRNLKRAAGGTMDTEFIVQMLQLKHGRQKPEVRETGTIAGLKALSAAGCLAAEDAELLASSYGFQRSIEARIRLMNSAGRHEVPEEDEELKQLAFLLGVADADKLRDEVLETFCEVRGVFNRVFADAVQGR